MKLFLAACVSLVMITTAYAYHFLDIPPSPSLVRSFGIKQVDNRFKNADYMRYKQAEVISLGHDRKYLVSGSLIVIHIGQVNDGDYPTTKFQELEFFVIVKAYCAYMSSECFDIARLVVSGEASTRPVL